MSLAPKVIAGDVRAIARLIRDIDDEQPNAVEELKKLYPHTGRAYLLGVTGSPGSGKSTLTDQLIKEYRAADLRVGVVAIDPTSPFSGGAILGDRIRMRRHETDDGVFIRSLATRGNLGGLTRSTSDVVKVLDASGFEVIIIETVGVGQDEVEIVGAADTTVVMLVPGSGDEIQVIKAGILEIADLLVVNKADRDGADKTARELEFVIEIGEKLKPSDTRDWVPPIIRTVATKGEGIADLFAAIGRHREYLRRQCRLEDHRRDRARADLVKLVRDIGFGRLSKLIDLENKLPELVEKIASRRSDPYSAAESLVAAAFGDDDR